MPCVGWEGVEWGGGGGGRESWEGGGDEGAKREGVSEVKGEGVNICPAGGLKRNVQQHTAHSSIIINTCTVHVYWKPIQQLVYIQCTCTCIHVYMYCTCTCVHMQIRGQLSPCN